MRQASISSPITITNSQCGTRRAGLSEVKGAFSLTRTATASGASLETTGSEPTKTASKTLTPTRATSEITASSMRVLTSRPTTALITPTTAINKSSTVAGARGSLDSRLIILTVFSTFSHAASLLASNTPLPKPTTRLPSAIPLVARLYSISLFLYLGSYS